jgi:dihydrofolate reductase
MAQVIAGMTISLDGFVADRGGSASRLYPDLHALRETAYMREQVDETGAVLMGRRSFEMGDPDSYVGNYEFQVPIFVLTHEPPRAAPKQDEHLTFTFVTDGVESALEQARTVADDLPVHIAGGPSTSNQFLAAGLVDELRLQIAPTIIGHGRRLFEGVPSLELETISVRPASLTTHVHYRVKNR